MNTFQSLVIDKKEDVFSIDIKQLLLEDLPAGDVLINVKYSSVNYKDGLASIPDGKIVQSYPFVPGIDLAGVVVASKDEKFREGDQVIVTSYELGVSHFGGYSEYARVPSEWVIPLPEGLSLKESMVFGTAGFTAALSVQCLEEQGVKPGSLPVLVTGATGGVGSMAVAMLAKQGFHVVASTGKTSEHEYLRKLGAKEIIAREEVSPEKIRPLGKQRWSGVIDPVGGDTLSYALSTTAYGGAVAVSGMTAGTTVNTTVLPFILRGVKLIGIDSVYCPMETRQKIWERLASDLKPESLLDYLSSEVTLEQLPTKLQEILQAKVRGRTIVKIS
ncbi:NADPH:quinone oxidoreductase family protein [Sporosarcina sp. CAU 1771]